MSSLRLVARNMVLRPSTRLFTTTPYTQKSATEAAKDTLKSVDRTVSDAAVKGIEKGEQATQNLKSTVGIKSKEAEGSAKEMSGEAQGKASEMAGEVKGKAQEVKGQAKGKAEEMKSKM